MSVLLQSGDRTRLAKLLGMLGSDHAGERDAAALAASRLLQQRGATWADVVELPPTEKKFSDFAPWRTTVARSLARPGLLSRWEFGFLIGLPKFPRLSVKQQNCLQKIANRVLP